MLQSRSSSSWAESLTDCVYIYTHSRAYIMHWMPTHWDAFFMLLRTHCDSRWLAYLVHVSDGWMHPSPLSLSCSRKCSFRALDMRTQLECDGRKGVAPPDALENLFWNIVGALFLLRGSSFKWDPAWVALCQTKLFIRLGSHPFKLFITADCRGAINKVLCWQLAWEFQFFLHKGTRHLLYSSIFKI